MIGLLAPLLLRIGIPERLHRWATYAALAVLTIALVWWWFARHDAKVIERHEGKREATAAKAEVKSAEERVVEAFENQRLRDQREAAIAKAEASEAAKPAEARSTLSAQDRALNCQRLRDAGLTGGAKFKELCR